MNLRSLWQDTLQYKASSTDLLFLTVPHGSRPAARNFPNLPAAYRPTFLDYPEDAPYDRMLVRT